jgi:glycosyltransferase involved in cell wall biosynthesis
MRILHYSLGLPPYRSGGLTKYATDLIIAQQKYGDKVFILYPESDLLGICFEKKIYKRKSNIGDFEYVLVNSSIIPLLYGIKDPLTILSSESKKVNKFLLKKFYNEVEPDVFHIHTLMGLSLDLVVYLKSKGVKIVYTSHDYYGLCLRVNFINYKGDLCESPDGKNCAICNYNAPSNLFLKIRNSKIVLKNKKFLSFANRKKLEGISPFNELNLRKINSEKIKEYEKLLFFYIKIFSCIDVFHFNSSLTAEVYKKHFNVYRSLIIPITHGGIQDNRKLKIAQEENINFAFIGNISMYKGFPLLMEVLMDLQRNKINNWNLTVWGNESIEITNNAIICKGKYKESELKKVFSQMDLLIVPSICKETFSLISLEAISFGVPVLVTSNVGARDIISFYEPSFVVEPTKDALKEKLKEVLSDVSILLRYNQKILSEPFDFDFNSHVQKIKEQLYLE